MREDASADTAQNTTMTATRGTLGILPNRISIKNVGPTASSYSGTTRRVLATYLAL